MPGRNKKKKGKKRGSGAASGAGKEAATPSFIKARSTFKLVCEPVPVELSAEFADAVLLTKAPDYKGLQALLTTHPRLLQYFDDNGNTLLHYHMQANAEFTSLQREKNILNLRQKTKAGSNGTEQIIAQAERLAISLNRSSSNLPSCFTLIAFGNPYAFGLANNAGKTPEAIISDMPKGTDCTKACQHGFLLLSDERLQPPEDFLDRLMESCQKDRRAYAKQIYRLIKLREPGVRSLIILAHHGFPLDVSFEGVTGLDIDEAITTTLAYARHTKHFAFEILCKTREAYQDAFVARQARLAKEACQITRLQAAVRGRQARHHMAATQVQATAKGWLVRNNISRRQEAQAEHAATRIQTSARALLARRKVNLIRTTHALFTPESLETLPAIELVTRIKFLADLPGDHQNALSNLIHALHRQLTEGEGAEQSMRQAIRQDLIQTIFAREGDCLLNTWVLDSNRVSTETFEQMFLISAMLWVPDTSKKANNNDACLFARHINIAFKERILEPARKTEEGRALLLDIRGKVPAEILATGEFDFLDYACNRFEETAPVASFD